MSKTEPTSSPVNFKEIEDKELSCELSKNGKSPKEIAEHVGGKSFAQEIEHDKNAIAVLLGRGQEAKNALENNTTIENFTEQELKHEAASVDIFKRALILVGAGGMQIIDGEKSVSASENQLPLASYLCHGSRIAVEIPADSGDTLINWLTTGNATKPGLSDEQDQQLASQAEKYVCNRAAATHGVKFDKDDNVKETKGFFIGARDYLSNKLLGKKTNHYGVNVGLKAPLGVRAADGEIVHAINGEHGHLYMHYVAPTKDKPGALLIGSEDAAPTSEKHSKFGVGGKVSAAGGSKFPDLKLKHQLAGEKEYEKTVIPQKYNGLSIKMDANSLNNLTNIKSDEFGPELAARMPAENVEAFKKNSQNFHQKPEFQGPKIAVSTRPEISNLKLLANKITFGLAYKQDVIKYKENSQKFKLQIKLQTSWEKEQKVTTAKPKTHTKTTAANIVLTPKQTPTAQKMASKRDSQVSAGNQ